MLSHLSINNFAIVKSLQLELAQGMTTITGETGAGKSIAIDALGLCLGSRAEASMVRPGEEKADISASFLLENNRHAQVWLEDNDLLDSSDENHFKECIVRRVITKEGRSRAYINAIQVPLAQLKALGQYLMNIHGQHAHHLLMRQESQLTMLDQYAGHQNLLVNCRKHYASWRQTKNELNTLYNNRQENLAQKQLLEYQIKELDELALTKDEFAELEQEHKRLSSRGQIVSTCQHAIHTLYESDDVNALSLLQSVNHSLLELAELDLSLKALPEMLAEAMIQIEEINTELRHYADGIDVDPETIAQVEQRYSDVMLTARKHHVMPEDLYTHHQSLKQQIKNLDCSDERVESLIALVEEKHQTFLKAAQKLSQSRQRYAKELNKLITQSMHELSMEKAVFDISLTKNEEQSSPLGIDQVCFMVSTNPGQPIQPLAKVASGGELSRISLAIQVITAQKVQTPSLIFDEVDVGISGPTASVVGKMLRQLGESTQVLCVTHLPQVAGCGHQQLFVAKKSTKGQTQTQMYPLDTKARIEELARLLGGSSITEFTLANAKELLIAA